MLYSRIVGALAAILLIAAILIFSGKKSREADRKATDAISILKSSGEDKSRDCEAFSILQEVAAESRKAKLMIAEMYARGMCQAYDVEKAIEWYHKADLFDANLGKALFEAASWEVPTDEDSGQEKEKFISLLNKAKEFGYKPTQAEIEHLPQQYRNIFM